MPVDGVKVGRVGVYQNEPKIFVDEGGRAAGILVDVLNQIAKMDGWKLEYLACEWAACLDMLLRGELDLMPDVAYSREMAELFDFHEVPVIESWSQVYAKKGGMIDNIADLEYQRVATLADSVQLLAFERMIEEFGLNIPVISMGTFAETFAAVRDGYASAAIVTHFFGDYFNREYGPERTPIVFGVAELHFATARGRNSDLLVAIDHHLGGWIQESNSVYYDILERWMERPPFR